MAAKLTLLLTVSLILVEKVSSNPCRGNVIVLTLLSAARVSDLDKLHFRDLHFKVIKFFQRLVSLSLKNTNTSWFSENKSFLAQRFMAILMHDFEGQLSLCACREERQVIKNT